MVNSMAHGVLMAGILFLLVPVQFFTQSYPSWGPLEFLLGEWSGTGSGNPGEVVAGKSSFTFDLDKHILVRKSQAELAARPGEKTGSLHFDLLIISPGAGEVKYRGVYFDNEGHVIQYRISCTEKPQTALFESEATGGGPRFRLIYTVLPDGLLNVEFQIARPGGEFQVYTKGVLKKAGMN
jgi:hypothetical protein